MGPVPDQNGVRYCKHCKEFIPLNKFPSGPRRYVCKAHMWTSSGQRSTKKMRANPEKMLLTKVWARAYKDRGVFKQTRIAITQTEIGDLLRELDVTLSHGEIALVPTDPTVILSVSNSALVSINTRNALMKKWKNSGKDEYCKLLQENDASEASEHTTICASDVSEASEQTVRLVAGETHGTVDSL
jgi:hypothetical protein